MTIALTHMTERERFEVIRDMMHADYTPSCKADFLVWVLAAEGNSSVVQAYILDHLLALVPDLTGQVLLSVGLALQLTGAVKSAGKASAQISRAGGLRRERWPGLGSRPTRPAPDAP